MKRELKFKAKYHGYWVYFDLNVGFTDEGYEIYKELIQKEEKFYQYTGKNDKHGNHIYEGDKIYCVANDKYKEQSMLSEVAFSDEGQFVVRSIFSLSNPEFMHGLALTWGGWDSIEITNN